MLPLDRLLEIPEEGLPVAVGAYKNQTILIDGCAPGTIPFGIALVFAWAGRAKKLLVHLDRNEDSGAVTDHLKRVIPANSPTEVFAHVADFRERSQVVGLARWARAVGGLPDVVIHGAGLTRYSSITDHEPPDDGAVMKIKLDSLRILGSEFLPAMKLRGSGVWGCLGSIQAEYTCGEYVSNGSGEAPSFLGNLDYALANEGVDIWCKLVARDFGPHGVFTFTHRPSITDNARHRASADAVACMELHAKTVPARMVPTPIDHGVAVYSLAIPRLARIFLGNAHDPWCGEGQILPQR